MKNWGKGFEVNNNGVPLDPRCFLTNEIYENDFTHELVRNLNCSPAGCNDFKAVPIYGGKEFFPHKADYHKIGDLDYKKSVDWQKPLEIRVFNEDMDSGARRVLIDWRPVSKIDKSSYSYDYLITVYYNTDSNRYTRWYFRDNGFAYNLDNTPYAEVRNIESNGRKIGKIYLDELKKYTYDRQKFVQAPRIEIISTPYGSSSWYEMYCSRWQPVSSMGSGTTKFNIICEAIDRKEKKVAKIKWEKKNGKYAIKEFINFMSKDDIIRKYGREVYKRYIVQYPHMLKTTDNKIDVWLNEFISRYLIADRVFESEAIYKEVMEEVRSCGTRLSNIIKEKDKSEIIIEEI